MISDTFKVCEELCSIGNSAGLKCHIRKNYVFCLKYDVVVYPRLHSEELLFKYKSDIILEVDDGVIRCTKCRYSNNKEISWDLCDPGVFESILCWFKSQRVQPEKIL